MSQVWRMLSLAGMLWLTAWGFGCEDYYGFTAYESSGASFSEFAQSPVFEWNEEWGERRTRAKKRGKEHEQHAEAKHAVDKQEQKPAARDERREHERKEHEHKVHEHNTRAKNESGERDRRAEAKSRSEDHEQRMRANDGDRDRRHRTGAKSDEAH